MRIFHNLQPKVSCLLGEKKSQKAIDGSIIPPNREDFAEFHHRFFLYPNSLKSVSPLQRRVLPPPGHGPHQPPPPSHRTPTGGGAGARAAGDGGGGVFPTPRPRAPARALPTAGNPGGPMVGWGTAPPPYQVFPHFQGRQFEGEIVPARCSTYLPHLPGRRGDHPRSQNAPPPSSPRRAWGPALGGPGRTRCGRWRGRRWRGCAGGRSSSCPCNHLADPSPEAGGD